MKDIISEPRSYENICVGREYILTKKIGEGSFGKIYTARSKYTKKSFAVKLVIYIFYIRK